MNVLAEPGKALCSVIIVNFNAGAFLVDCVQSVLSSTQPVEIFVVDNASADNSLRIMLERTGNDPRVLIIRNKRNIGFAAASNLGLVRAQGKRILFLNPDCIIQSDTIYLMNEVMDKYPDAAMAGPLILNPDGSEQEGARRAIPTPRRSFVRAFGLSRLFHDFVLNKDSLPDVPVYVEAVSGSFMFVRQSAIEDVGPLDDGYFLHCEDLDWCVRFGRKGWKVLFVPGISVIHFKSVCSINRPVFVEWQKHKGMIRFYKKFFRRQYPLALMGLVILGVWFRFSAIALLYPARQIINGIKQK